MNMGSSATMDMDSSSSMVMTAMSSVSSMMMDMSASKTGTAAAAATTGASMDMDMGGGMGPDACKISMLWNWYTVNSCFIARTWHVRSSGGFAGTCIGVILLVIALEAIRRFQREFDRRLRSKFAARGQIGTVEGGASPGSSTDGKNVSTVVASRRQFFGNQTTRPDLVSQIIRSLLYMVQFAVGYFVMLLAMYYNGYIIICIFIGAFLGAMIFQWDNLQQPELREPCCS